MSESALSSAFSGWAMHRCMANHEALHRCSEVRFLQHKARKRSPRWSACVCHTLLMVTSRLEMLLSCLAMSARAAPAVLASLL